ncbi:DUF397 domain-containing protein [Saccharopolyspora rhizosphaerae]|uniref:DUF397 domain-containing protein n=1 Tax=Saccharopolyspora rhizosphaerae TaxID=2492662 RepID=A0A426JWP9_9PSEU|nr:DUF397 domain-containing protein [Saccharopolyspora rhizosphaerae]
MTAEPAGGRTPSRSRESGSRIEVLPSRSGAIVRDVSRRSCITTSAEQWQAFVAVVKTGRFDR